MVKESYSTSDIYQGGYSSFNPDYGSIFTGYRVSASELGAPTKPDTANQIQQVSTLLNQGIIPIEVGALKPEVFDQIPKQHFKEINRMAKLSGAKISVHAPIVEASGIGEQGWSEENRELAEHQLNAVVEKSLELDDKGGVPITIHGSGSIPGVEYIMTPEGKKVHKLIVVERETGKPVQALQEEEKYLPGMTAEELRKGKKRDIMKELKDLNESQWDNSLSQVIGYKEDADRTLTEYAPQIEHLMDDWKKGNYSQETLKEILPKHYETFNKIENAEIYLQNAQQYLTGLFNKAYKFGTEENKRLLEKASEEFRKTMSPNPIDQSRALQELIINLRKVQPELYQPIEDFAVEHSAKTFANVAFNAFEKANEKKINAPKILVENMFPGMAFSSSEEMNRLILESKNKFVEQAIKKGFSESDAKFQADNIIGMTLDVGHLNISRKKGFQEKDILEEVKKFGKNVKHVHLTDNFGRSDSHLPPGMGNVPFKGILEELEKAGVKDARKIVEAGGFVQHFGVSPLPYTLEAMGSPLYSMRMAPYWNQAIGFQQGYFSGYGQMLPDINYQTFGAGFSQLPQELGGQRGGGGGRMSGRPME